MLPSLKGWMHVVSAAKYFIPYFTQMYSIIPFSTFTKHVQSQQILHIQGIKCMPRLGL